MRCVMRLRAAPERRIVRGRRANRGQALIAALWLVSLGMTFFSVCLWCWCFDLGLVGVFPFEKGAPARWQIWFGLGLVFQLLAAPLVSYSGGGVKTEPAPRPRRPLRRYLGEATRRAEGRDKGRRRVLPYQSAAGRVCRVR